MSSRYHPKPVVVTDDDMIAVRVALRQRIDRLRPLRIAPEVRFHIRESIRALRRFSVCNTQWRIVNP